MALKAVSSLEDTFLASLDRKSTRLNSSHLVISYAVFCLKKKKQNHQIEPHLLRALSRHTDGLTSALLRSELELVVARNGRMNRLDAVLMKHRRELGMLAL